MYTRIRTLLGATVVLLTLTACGGAAPAETTPAVLTAVPLENQTANPTSEEVVPAESSAYPGVAPSVPNELPSAYPGTTTTP